MFESSLTLIKRYLLPLPKRATLVEFEAQVDGKSLNAVVKQESNEVTSFHDNEQQEDLLDAQEEYLKRLGREDKLLKVPLGYLPAKMV